MNEHMNRKPPDHRVVRHASSGPSIGPQTTGRNTEIISRAFLVFLVVLMPVTVLANDIPSAAASDSEFLLPQYVGFTQVGDLACPPDWGEDSMKFQSNTDTVAQIVANGFQAVHLWPHESIQSDDLAGVFCNPGIKVIAIRPSARLGRDMDISENNDFYTGIWENEDFGQVAYDILEKYGDLWCRNGEPLTVILNNWEGDWQVKGAFNQFGTPSPRRLHRAEAEYEMAQWGIQWAREQFPDAQLRIYFGLVTNHRKDDKYEWTLTRDLIPRLDPQPDLIGISFYGDQGDETPAEAVETIKRHTGYPVSRMYVAETGISEDWPGRQRTLLGPRLEEMADIGLRLIFVWTWKQYWPGELDDVGHRTKNWFGNWVTDESQPGGVHNNVLDCWTSGLEFLQEFRLTFDQDPLPNVTPPACSE